MARTTRTNRGTQQLRATHRAEVTDLLRTHGPLARADVAERLGLTRSAVTAIVTELIGEGVLREIGPPPPASDPVPGRAPRGRPRVLIGCDPAAARVVAAQVGARWARVVLADAAGDVLGREVADVTGATPGEVVERVADLADQLAASHDGPPVTTVGICVPGRVDTTTGTVLRSEPLGWEDVPLAELLGTRLGIPVFAQDVTQAATLAEVRHGVAAGARDAVVLDYGARIGVGLVLDGRLHRGASGLAGSMGHTPVFGDATPCRCGRRGCLEAVAGVRAMVPLRVDRRHGPEDEVAAFAETVDRMRTGDATVEATVHGALDRGAHAAATLVALLDPDVVVLTGLIVDYPDLTAHLLTRIEALVPPENRRHLTLHTSTLGLEAWVRGAILVALQQLRPEVRGALSGAAAAQPDMTTTSTDGYLSPPQPWVAREPSDI
jgi:predicted NBD/HSP70 family sugar kinase